MIFRRGVRQLKHQQLIADELYSILQTAELDLSIRQRLDQLRLKFLELSLEFEQLKSENSRLKNGVSNQMEQPISLDELSKKILLWLSKRTSETSTAIAFGVCVDKSKAQNALTELLQLHCVNRSEVNNDRWTITDFGMTLAQSLPDRTQVRKNKSG